MSNYNPAKQREYTRKSKSKRNKTLGGIICPLCGYYWLSLGNHISSAHGITAFDYRKENGWVKSHQLTCHQLHQQRVNQGHINMPKGVYNPIALSKAKISQQINGLDMRAEHSELAKQRYKKSRKMQLVLGKGSIYKKPAHFKICPICKNKFKCVPSNEKRGWGKFCSLKCSGADKTNKLMAQSVGNETISELKKRKHKEYYNKNKEAILLKKALYYKAHSESPCAEWRLERND